MKVYLGRYPSYKKGEEEKERKIRVRIDKWDTWSMADTLALIIHPMLVQLKASQHGAPPTDDEDVPKELRSTSAPPKENEWDTDSLWFARWEWVLDEMIWAFSQVLDEDAEDQFNSGNIELIWLPLNKAGDVIGEGRELAEDNKLFAGYTKKDISMYKMENGPNHTHKVDEEARLAWYNRKKNGLRLFGKYYEDLWD